MAHGKCTAQIAGYVAKDITLDTSEKGGENYCRLSLIHISEPTRPY